MRASAKRFYSILVGIGLLFGAVYVYSSYIKSAYEGVQKLRGERSAESKQLGEAKATTQVVSGLLEKYQSVSEIEDKLSLSLPVGEKIPEVLTQLQGLSDLNSIKIDSMSFQYLPIEYAKEKTVLRPRGALRLSLRFASKHDNLKRFISSLETNIRLLDIVSLKIDGGGSTKNPNLNCNLTVDSYYQVKE